MTSKTEPKVAPRETVRKLRLELCAMAEALAEARRLLTETAAHAARCACQRDNARRLLKDIWEAATEGETPFFQRLAKLQPFGRQVGEELKALEGEEQG